MKNTTLRGKLHGGNSHIWFDEGKSASYPATVSRLERGAKPRRGVLLSKTNCMLAMFCALSALAGLADEPVLQRCVEGPDWVALENRHEIVPGSALDFSKMGIQDAPAGKYGWTKSVNGHAEFEKRPGQAARFYGVNLCNTANYLSDGEIERLTDRLVRLGYNSIRIHHYDDMWSKDTDGARDKLDRLMAACIRKGLYLTTDLYVSRKCTWRELGIDKDGQAKGAKLRMMSSEAAFDNWKRFSRDFLTRVNPYTGRSLADEPAMPFIVILNESSPHSGWDWVKKELPEFRELWKRWLTELRAQVPNAYPEADPDRFPEQGGWWNPGKGSDITAAFWAWCNESFCKRAAKYLREELKVKALLATENHGPVLPEILRARAAAGDYVDFHFYTEHASPASKSQRRQLGYQATSQFHNRNVLADVRLPYRGVAFNRVWGRPLTVSESNMGGPNTWRAMAGLVTGSYAAIQDWTSIWTFAMAHSDRKLFDGCEAPPGRFDLALDPILQATDRLPTLLFLRGDQQTPKSAFANVFTKEAMDPADDKCLSSRPSWTDRGLAWRARLGVAFDEPLPAGVTPLKAYPEEKPAEEPPSVGVTVDEKKGEITVVGPFTCGGYALAGSTVAAGPLTAQISGHRALVAVTSLDRSDITRSPRLLLWHLTDVHGEGFSWGGTCSGDNCSRTGIGNWGTGKKLLAHVGTAEVALALAQPERYAVYALDTVGNRRERLPAKTEGGRICFTAGIRPPEARLYYEVVRDDVK